MKFLRVALLCHRNLRCIKVRSPISCIYNENIDIHKKNISFQPTLNRELNTMSFERNSSNCKNEPLTIPIVYYDEIKDLPNHPEKLLIDVREPQELIDTGIIPTSINIPLGKVVEALSVMPDDKFKKLYGIEKPTENKYMIFHCKLGKRAEMASESAVGLGFKNVKNYKGSWVDWAEHEGLPQ